MLFHSSRGNTIHYQFTGHNHEQTLVFIHSLGTDYRIWEQVAESLLPQGNVLLYDLRGHGLSDFYLSQEGLEDDCTDLKDLLDFLEIKKNIIPVGISVGGLIALLLSNRIPLSISKLILCDTSFKIGSATSWNERIEKITKDGLTSIAESVVGRWFSMEYKIRYPEIIQKSINMLESSSLQGYIQTCTSIRNADVSEIVMKINTPTLCLVGDEDTSTSPEEVKKLSDLILGSRYVVIEHSGHLPCLDNPQKMSELIREFVWNNH